ncbi:exodeoxyribonuclease VII large subunit [Lederbergia wuyishanensis]|uniref:Exodeoxyribonuclease 7 large subunit n=1 Tax=Lederbergia wuyishanensis TaxID=1347903 RepID=A0ABU0D194_9BACI|nr:exodeoxyribonuclease VII large subunit [Lederbergia wuyishanensis]MCJ8006787.1 exodeoxyribonuclease VII large subunit [Lederbergia wuyishanensis]MDQ0342169.1 exodeoxyribonuclease VII large subunit [Lederbergia wuyishanensis]
MTERQYLTVKALTKYIKRKFDVDPHLSNVYVKGEISNFKKHSSGHLYFTLKDESARVMAVMFSSFSQSMKFIPENGMNVLIRGSITVYEASGQYQIYVQEMLPDGIGELFLAYEQLKNKLENEGLFHPDKKKQIPVYPKKIGIITSPTGAAIRDILTTINRRYPIGKLIVLPVLVQGKQASASIAAAIKKANELSVADVLIVGRGGGSIEELWAFNEEIVARAIYNSQIPIISAVGHETDFTIADFVADVRAATPTGAAELAVPHIEDLMERLLNRKNRLYRGMVEITKEKRGKLNLLENSYMIRNPRKLYEQKWESVDRMTDRLQRGQEKILFQKMDQFQRLHKVLATHHPAMKLQMHKEKFIHLRQQLTQQAKIIVNQKSSEFSTKVATLEALSPLNILKRGYSVAYTKAGNIVNNTNKAHIGEQITLQVTDGELFCTIDHIEKGESNG